MKKTVKKPMPVTHATKTLRRMVRALEDPQSTRWYHDGFVVFQSDVEAIKVLLKAARARVTKHK